MTFGLRFVLGRFVSQDGIRLFHVRLGFSSVDFSLVFSRFVPVGYGSIGTRPAAQEKKNTLVQHIFADATISHTSATFLHFFWGFISRIYFIFPPQLSARLLIRRFHLSRGFWTHHLLYYYNLFATDFWTWKCRSQPFFFLFRKFRSFSDSQMEEFDMSTTAVRWTDFLINLLMKE